MCTNSNVTEQDFIHKNKSILQKVIGNKNENGCRWYLGQMIDIDKSKLYISVRSERELNK